MNKEQILKITEQVYQSSGYLEDFLSQLSLALDKEEESWEPKYGDEVYTIKMTGEIDFFRWTNSRTDKKYMDFKNVFRTREQAEARLEAIKNL